jgi:hypothetical protein
MTYVEIGVKQTKGQAKKITSYNSSAEKILVQRTKLYPHFKRYHEEFMEEELLCEIHHPHDTNHVEGFNKLITRFLPKEKKN